MHLDFGSYLLKWILSKVSRILNVCYTKPSPLKHLIDTSIFPKRKVIEQLHTYLVHMGPNHVQDSIVTKSISYRLKVNCKKNIGLPIQISAKRWQNFFLPFTFSLVPINLHMINGLNFFQEKVRLIFTHHFTWHQSIWFRLFKN